MAARVAVCCSVAGRPGADGVWGVVWGWVGRSLDIGNHALIGAPLQLRARPDVQTCIAKEAAACALLEDEDACEADDGCTYDGLYNGGNAGLIPNTITAPNCTATEAPRCALLNGTACSADPEVRHRPSTPPPPLRSRAALCDPSVFYDALNGILPLKRRAAVCDSSVFTMRHMAYCP
eukprot:SAG11_NODE_2095_length_3833_cov_4.084092_2_plen_178_part_00